MSDDYDTVACPKCRKEHVDMDGFGFIACLGDGCGYCTHPAKHKAEDDGDWYCDVCGVCVETT